MDFSETVRMYRAKNNLGQRDLAEAISCSLTQISKSEKFFLTDEEIRNSQAFSKLAKLVGYEKTEDYANFTARQNRKVEIDFLLKELRKEMFVDNLTQTDLAKLLNISRTDLSHCLTGKIDFRQEKELQDSLFLLFPKFKKYCEDFESKTQEEKSLFIEKNRLEETKKENDRLEETKSFISLSNSFKINRGKRNYSIINYNPKEFNMKEEINKKRKEILFEEKENIKTHTLSLFKEFQREKNKGNTKHLNDNFLSFSLENFRLKRNMNLKEFSKFVNVHPSDLSKIEKGYYNNLYIKNRPCMKNLAKIINFDLSFLNNNSSDEDKSISLFFKLFQVKYKITQSELAKKLKISEGFLRFFEKGYIKPTCNKNFLNFIAFNIPDFKNFLYDILKTKKIDCKKFIINNEYEKEIMDQYLTSDSLPSFGKIPYKTFDMTILPKSLFEKTDDEKEVLEEPIKTDDEKEVLEEPSSFTEEPIKMKTIKSSNDDNVPVSIIRKETNLDTTKILESISKVNENLSEIIDLLKNNKQQEEKVTKTNVEKDIYIVPYSLERKVANKYELNLFDSIMEDMKLTKADIEKCKAEINWYNKTFGENKILRLTMEEKEENLKWNKN